MNYLNLGSGKASWFGGPNDNGVAKDEGLALIEFPDLANWWFRYLFLPIEKYNDELGLARNLNPLAFYCAMRWDYSQTSREVLRNSFVNVRANGKSILARPCDYGPAPETNRLIDLSPGALSALSCKTDDTVSVELYYP